MRNSINILKDHGVVCDLIIKSKDVLEKLLIENKESYINILPEGRNPGRMGILTGLIKREFRLFKQIGNKHYDLLVGTDPSLAHIGFLKRVPVITVLEDDIDVIQQLARITFPFTSLILTPEGCKTGKYEKKTISYRGFMKLAYLHPRWFNKEVSKVKQPYFLIRASALGAYHDEGISGFNVPLLEKIVLLLQERGSVYISSEAPLTGSLKLHELKINPSEMQQLLANSLMLISDSQSMTMEAAMLGVPSVRFSDFAGRISVLEELEHVYNLTYGIRPGDPEKLFDRIKELLSVPDLEKMFASRRAKMLSEKIDVTAFLAWFLENYPESSGIMKQNPDYQDRFR